MGFRILIVEDEDEIADYLVRGLREEGFSVERAADGEAGWHYLKTGTWDVVLITQDPSGKEVRTKGTKTTTKHTEFHTLDAFEGEFMGLRLVGHGVNGYCAVRGQYFTLWTDSMTPSPMLLFGDYDAGKRELALRGECYGMSGKLEKCRTVTRFVDDDHVSWALYGAGPDGREVQFLRNEYTRRR